MSFRSVGFARQAEEPRHRIGEVDVARGSRVRPGPFDRGLDLNGRDHLRSSEAWRRAGPVTDGRGSALPFRAPKSILAAKVRRFRRQQFEGVCDSWRRARAALALAEKGTNPPRNLMLMHRPLLFDHRAGDDGEPGSLRLLDFLVRRNRVVRQDVGLWAIRRGGRRPRAATARRRGGRRLLRSAARGFQRRPQFAQLFVAPVEPVRAPDPVDAPAETFEHFLTQPVALARPEGRMIGRPVAFDCEDEARPDWRDRARRGRS